MTVQVVTNIKDGLGQPINGTLQIRLESPVVNVDDGFLVMPSEFTVPIVNGITSTNLIANGYYFFQVFGQDNLDKPLMSFRTRLPDSTVALDLVDLAKLPLLGYPDGNYSSLLTKVKEDIGTVAGIKGDKGEPGLKGDKGDKGDPGLPGATTIDGIAGLQAELDDKIAANSSATLNTLNILNGRLDLQPGEAKAEFRVTGANTQFGIYNLDNRRFYFRSTSDGDTYISGHLYPNNGSTRAALLSDIPATWDATKLTGIIPTANLPPSDSNSDIIQTLQTKTDAQTSYDWLFNDYTTKINTVSTQAIAANRLTGEIALANLPASVKTTYSPPDPRLIIECHEDFLSGGTTSFAGVSGNNAGGAVVGTTSPTPDIVGLVRLNTNGGATNRAAIITNTGNFTIGSMDLNAYFKCAVPILSSTADTFTVRCGFIQSVSLAPANGLYWQLDPVTSIWQLVRISNGVTNTVSSGVTAVVNRFYRLTVSLTRGHVATGTIDGVSFDATVTSNTVDTVGMVAGIFKATGTTSRSLDLDYVGYRINASGAER